jgi:hypothetical protein
MLGVFLVAPIVPAAKLHQVQGRRPAEECKPRRSGFGLMQFVVSDDEYPVFVLSRYEKL